MKKSFPYSDTNKRYHTFDYYCRHRFGKKMIKIPLNAGFTCPNRDGKKGFGGCTFCSAEGSGDFASGAALSIAEQFEEQRRILAQKWPDAGCIAYFQSYTNTYAPVETLRSLWEQALCCGDVAGISIATRADCLPDSVLDALEGLQEKTWLSVELGLQTISDQTAARMNRCHSYEEFCESVQKLRRRNIPVCVHLINGLPGETPEMMQESAKAIAKMDIQAVKIHLLHLLEGTALAEQWKTKPFPLLSREEYVSIVCDQLELLPPSVVIQRLTGDGDRKKLIGPLWSRDKRAVLNEIDKELLRRNSFQGIRFQRNID